MCECVCVCVCIVLHLFHYIAVYANHLLYSLTLSPSLSLTQSSKVYLCAFESNCNNGWESKREQINTAKFGESIQRKCEKENIQKHLGVLWKTSGQINPKQSEIECAINLRRRKKWRCYFALNHTCSIVFAHILWCAASNRR